MEALSPPGVLVGCRIVYADGLPRIVYFDDSLRKNVIPNGAFVRPAHVRSEIFFGRLRQRSQRNIEAAQIEQGHRRASNSDFHSAARIDRRYRRPLNLARRDSVRSGSRALEEKQDRR